MARIFYSMAGEGRGHATRVRVVVEALRAEHELTLFAPGHAFEVLEPLYRHTPVRVVPIPGLLFAYNKRRQVDFLRTTTRSLGFAWRLPALRARITEEIRRDPPDLAIVDFEPALPRAARACGVPFISFDHQHFLVYNDLSSLPRWLRRQAAFMGLAVRCMYRGQAASIVSSFYQPRLKRGCEHVRQIGVLLRDEILRAVPSRQGHLAAYFRRFSIGRELAALKAGARGREVRIYGLGERPAEGPLRFMPMDEPRLIADLASCEGLVTTAGNQLVGEALYLGKPVLALPEPKNYEQYINAHFLGESGAGAWAEMERIEPSAVDAFVGRLDEFRARIDRNLVSGNRAALEAIRAHLPRRAKAPLAPLPVVQTAP
ncbi:MAG: teichoic acid biosynthesis protein [Planctomycetes bacterium]|nr:teichoic acid biosynthesis protein [Planctomycetota bacterium]